MLNRVVYGHNVIDQETRTTILGGVSLRQNYSLVWNPLDVYRGNLGQPNYLFLPFGPANMEVKVDIDEEQRLALLAKRIPYSITINLEDILRHGSEDQTRVFLLYKDKVIEGIPQRNIEPAQKTFYVTPRGWTKPGERLQGGSRLGVQSNRELLLPANPDFFKNLKILVGDKPPEATA